jgi:polysaccharide deacetylase family protein (PEP-CTERM system associated)
MGNRDPQQRPLTAELRRPAPEHPTDSEGRDTRLLSVDFEDWHQLARRRLGLSGWERPGEALGRQTERLLSLLDRLGARATFFVLGMAARSHPELVRRIAASGHEIGCHGDAHLLVSSQDRAEFEADLQQARATIEQLTGRPPIGYRAPAFSITRDTPWAYEALIDHGFAYDTSQHDSPRIRDRVTGSGGGPHPLECHNGTLWEFPVAVWQTPAIKLPVGGPSYWSLMPTGLVLKGVAGAGSLAGLYLHPYELDPEPLRLGLPSSATISQRAKALRRVSQRNLARRRTPEVLEAIASRYRLIPYGDAYAQLSGSARSRP